MITLGIGIDPASHLFGYAMIRNQEGIFVREASGTIKAKGKEQEDRLLSISAQLNNIMYTFFDEYDKPVERIRWYVEGGYSGRNKQTGLIIARASGLAFGVCDQMKHDSIELLSPRSVRSGLGFRVGGHARRRGRSRAVVTMRRDGSYALRSPAVAGGKGSRSTRYSTHFSPPWFAKNGRIVASCCPHRGFRESPRFAAGPRWGWGRRRQLRGSI